MNRKDPYHVTYSSMIEKFEDHIKWMEKEFGRRVRSGTMDPWHKINIIENYKTAVKVMKALKGINAKFITKDIDQKQLIHS